MTNTKYAIEFNVISSIYMEERDNSVHNNTFDFSENDLEILSGILINHLPEDDVAELLENYLPDLFYDIYEKAIEVAQHNTIFEGSVEVLLQYLLDVLDISLRPYRKKIKKKWLQSRLQRLAPPSHR